MVDGTPLRMTVFFQLFNVCFHQQVYVHIMHSYKKASEQTAGYLSEVLCSQVAHMNDTSLKKEAGRHVMKLPTAQNRSCPIQGLINDMENSQSGVEQLLRIKCRQ